MNTTKLKRHIGFTLAEVIIVIGILGIIAEVTIPTLVGNAQKQILATQLEKAYSTFPQGLKQYMASTGVTELGDTDLFDGVTSMNDPARQTVVDTAMKKIFKPAKVCYGSDTTCQYNLSYLGWSGLYTFMAPGRSANTYNFCTLDGACYSLNLATACNPNYNLVGPIKAYCGTLYVDTNGTKAPNKVGRDGFEFLLGQDGMIYPEASSAYSKLMSGVLHGISILMKKILRTFFHKLFQTGIIRVHPTPNGLAMKDISKLWKKPTFLLRVYKKFET